MDNNELENEVFDELDKLSVEYVTVENQLEEIGQSMKKCFDRIAWQNDKEAILRIIYHLPKCYQRFSLYERYYELEDIEENTDNADIDSKTVVQQKGGV